MTAFHLYQLLITRLPPADLVCRAITLRTAARQFTVDQEDTELRERFLVLTARTVGSAVLLTLNCFADRMTDQQYLQSRKVSYFYFHGFIRLHGDCIFCSLVPTTTHPSTTD